MVCPNLKCKADLYCVESRSEGNIRFRKYQCRICGKKLFTMETITDPTYAAREIYRLQREVRKRGR